MSTAKPSSASPTKRRDKEDAASAANPDLNLAAIGNYAFVKTLGEGNFAKVKLAKHKLTGAEVAIKIIDKTTLDEKKLGKLYREVRIMKMLHHPHIIKLYEVIETKRTVFLVMEHAAGGELYDYLVVHGKMKEKEARAKFRQILSAVNYCHRKRVIHRDLKAENLLLDANLDIKIADFGFSNMFDPDAKLDTFCGSPPYAAPELFQGRRYTGPEVDIWSLGVILYVLTTGCLPFDGKNLQEMRESVCRGKYRIPFYLSDTCEKLLRKFLIRDPYKRASLDMLTDDVWINEGYTDSPIQTDISTRVDQDEAIIKLIEARFKVDRDTILNSLRENVYDDIAALYYLLYHEKETRGKIEGEVLSMSGHTSSLHSSGNGTHFLPSPTTTVLPDTPIHNRASFSDASSRDRAQSAQPALTQPPPPQQAPKTPPAMNRIDEDGDAFPMEGMADIKTRPLMTNKPRKRRVTVGGEAEMLKLGESDDQQNSQMKQMLKNIQQNAVHEDEPTAVVPEPPKSRPPAIPQIVAPVTISQSPNASGVAVPDVDDGKDEGEGGQAVQRKRNNTIVGIIRNSIRRQSEIVGSTLPPPSATPLGTMTEKNNEAESTNSFSVDASTENTSKPGEPRSLRFTFNSNSTSSKPPDEIVQQVIHAATKHGISYTLVSRYLLECTANTNGEQVKFEVEVCKLPRLKNLHGLRFKRLGGSSGEYKDVCEKVLNSVAL